MRRQTFRPRVAIRGINPYVTVPAELAERLKAGWRKAMPVRAWLNGRPREGWPINLMPNGDGDFTLYLRGEARKAAGVAVGDEVRISLVFDADYAPLPAMPADFAAALAADAGARGGWSALTQSRQKEIVRYIGNLKSEAARRRNIERALRMLGGEGGRYMARDWDQAEGGEPAASGRRRR
ncbi:MAG: DUF1905 domain-containing protein [Bauldia sp.]